MWQASRVLLVASVWLSCQDESSCKLIDDCDGTVSIEDGVYDKGYIKPGAKLNATCYVNKYSDTHKGYTIKWILGNTILKDCPEPDNQSCTLEAVLGDHFGPLVCRIIAPGAAAGSPYCHIHVAEIAMQEDVTDENCADGEKVHFLRKLTGDKELGHLLVGRPVLGECYVRLPSETTLISIGWYLGDDLKGECSISNQIGEYYKCRLNTTLDYKHDTGRAFVCQAEVKKWSYGGTCKSTVVSPQVAPFRVVKNQEGSYGALSWSRSNAVQLVKAGEHVTVWCAFTDIDKSRITDNVRYEIYWFVKGHDNKDYKVFTPCETTNASNYLLCSRSGELPLNAEGQLHCSVYISKPFYFKKESDPLYNVKERLNIEVKKFQNKSRTVVYAGKMFTAECCINEPKDYFKLKWILGGSELFEAVISVNNTKIKCSRIEKKILRDHAQKMMACVLLDHNNKKLNEYWTSLDVRGIDTTTIIAKTVRTPARTITTSAPTEPISSRTEPTSARTEPTSARTEPTSARTEPTSARTEPTSARTEPTSAVTEPESASTKATSAPAEPTSTPTVPTIGTAVSRPATSVTNEPATSYSPKADLTLQNTTDTSDRGYGVYYNTSYLWILGLVVTVLWNCTVLVVYCRRKKFCHERESRERNNFAARPGANTTFAEEPIYSLPMKGNKNKLSEEPGVYFCKLGVPAAPTQETYSTIETPYVYYTEVADTEYANSPNIGSCSSGRTDDEDGYWNVDDHNSGSNRQYSNLVIADSEYALVPPKNKR